MVLGVDVRCNPTPLVTWQYVDCWAFVTEQPDASLSIVSRTKDGLAKILFVASEPA